MANAQFKDANGDTKYRKATGAGTDLDPFVLDNTISGSALPTGAATSAKQDTQITAEQAIQAAVEAIKTAVEILDNAVSGSEQQVDIVSSALPTGASTSAKQDDGIALLTTIDGDTGNAATSLAAMNDWDNTASDGASVSGDVAHDGVDAGEPVKIGAVAIAHGTNPTAVAAADRTNLYANRAGVQFVIGGHPNSLTVAAAYTAAQTDTAIITAAGGAKIVVTGIEVTADKANTVDVGFYIGFHATTTPTTTGVVAAHPGLAAGSGLVKGNGGAILGVGGDGDDLRITSEVPTSGSIRVVVTYFTIES